MLGERSSTPNRCSQVTLIVGVGAGDLARGARGGREATGAGAGDKGGPGELEALAASEWCLLDTLPGSLRVSVFLIEVI